MYLFSSCICLLDIHFPLFFSPKGQCLFYQEWEETKITHSEHPEEDKRLVFGMLFSFKAMVDSLSPSPSLSGYRKMLMDTCNLHVFETLSGFRFIVNTTSECTDFQSQLREIYSSIFVETVVKNPLCRYELGSKIENELFEERLATFLAPYTT